MSRPPYTPEQAYLVLVGQERAWRQLWSIAFRSNESGTCVYASKRARWAGKAAKRVLVSTVRAHD